MYNLLEKLRAGQPFTDGDRAYNNRALISTLKQIHDELDIAVLNAYGWPHDITDEQILENLVALNAQRAEEERNGHIRWLRPEYQAPDQWAHGGAPQQATLDGILAAETPIIAPRRATALARPKPSSPPFATCSAPAPATGQCPKLPPSSPAKTPKRNSTPSPKTSNASNGLATSSPPPTTPTRHHTDLANPP